MTTKIDMGTSDAHHRALPRSTTLVDEGRMDIDRAELRRLCEAATPGPWDVEPVRGHCEDYVVTRHEDHQQKPWGRLIGEFNFNAGHAKQNYSNDAKFVAAARTAIPALLDALDAAEARERKLREAMRALQSAAAAGLNIVKDETSPVFEFFAAIHRHAVSAVVSDDDPVNEAAPKETTP